MKPALRALFLVSALHLSAVSAFAETVELEPAAKAASDAKKSDEPKDATAVKKTDDAKVPAAAKKPDEAAKPTEAKKSAVVYKSQEIYQSSASLLGKKFAIGGYDAVAYHKENKPVPGTDEFTHAWKGATWRFSSKENLDTFVKEPEKYAPQYGGYCAFAVAHNGLSPGDPRHWRIVDGKLYLNIDASVQTKWNKDHVAFIKRGDTNWPTVLK
jgi:YHS domain-containing protein